jgi:hypothetical protein
VGSLDLPEWQSMIRENTLKQSVPCLKMKANLTTKIKNKIACYKSLLKNPFRCINFASVSTIYDQILELLFFEFCHFWKIVLKPSNSELMQNIIQKPDKTYEKTNSSIEGKHKCNPFASSRCKIDTSK